MIAPFLVGESFHERRPGVVDDIARSSKPSEDTRALMRAQARALGAFDGRAYCSRVACPTLCLAGAEDALAPAAEVERTAALIAAAEYHNEPTAGHSLLLESAAAVERIVAFLRR
jgi:pimeloyl-ACP methyl ester carboxylesterase